MKEQKETTLNAKLIMRGGDIIELSYPESIAIEVWEELEQTAKNGSMWYTSNWTDLKAMLNGHAIDHINMSQLIAIA